MLNLAVIYRFVKHENFRVLKKMVYLASIRSHLKNRILVQDRGGAEFQTGGIRLYVEDLKRGTNPAEKGGKPIDIFEMVSETSCRSLRKPLGDSLKAALFVLAHRSGKRLFDTIATIMRQGMGMVKVFATKIIKPASVSDDQQLLLHTRAVFTHHQVYS